MRFFLFFLFFCFWQNSFSQAPNTEFDGSYSILIESAKLTDISLNQTELEYVYSLRQPEERVVVKIRDFQVVLLSEMEYAEGIRFVKHTVYSPN